MSLLNKLKRRNVIRVGAAYVVTAWLIEAGSDKEISRIKDEAGCFVEPVMAMLHAQRGERQDFLRNS